MSFRDCIDRAVEAGEMDRARGEEAKRRYDELRDSLDLGPEAAEARAARETVERLAAEELEARRRRLIALGAQRRIAAAIDAADNPRQASIGLVDGIGLDVAHPSAVQVRRAARGRAHAMMADAIAEFRRDLLGRTRNRARLSNMVREAFGETTGDVAAREMAQGWAKASEFLRRQFNAAGGHIGKMERWGLPQHHSTLKVRQVAREEWLSFTLARLDTARMVDGASGQPFTETGLREALEDVYDTIATAGFSKITPSAAPAGTALANRRADHRFLHFRSAEAWLEYQERFGEGDPFTAMMAHIDAMARDIGAMRALGPNPLATIRWLQQRLRKTAAEGAGPLERNNFTAGQLGTIYGHYIGSVNAPARAFANTREMLVAIQLGAAALSAITDINFTRMAARFAGLNEARAVMRGLALLNPANAEDRKLAVRLGLIAEEASQVAAAQMRYVGELSGGEFTRRLADGVLRLSGLSPWTQAMRWGFGMEFMGALAERQGRALGALEQPLRDTLKRYGIDEAAWDAVRTTTPYEHEGAKFLRPEDVAARADIEGADELATRLLSMVQSETEFAVPSVTLRGKAFIAGDVKPGTVAGELLRSGLMYKSFATTLVMTHVMRGVRQRSPASRAAYMAELVITSTLMGALALQLKSLAGGRDPAPMDSWKFWIAAMTQGGGLGIFGDFVFQDTNRFGGGFAETLAGPISGLATDVHRLTVGNVRAAIEGGKMNLGADVTRFLKNYTPGGSIWYLKAAYERAVLDQLQLALDPDARQRQRRYEQTIKRERGQGFWWRPGRALPERAPELP
jgi:hypothetical protein